MHIPIETETATLSANKQREEHRHTGGKKQKKKKKKKNDVWKGGRSLRGVVVGGGGTIDVSWGLNGGRWVHGGGGGGGAAETRAGGGGGVNEIRASECIAVMLLPTSRSQSLCR